ncbi:EAL domain-containing protein [Roseomonas sp. OT10]|uniref:bifunctional diguanylate cyclase/phosphodiesterase n=1 Tax=Roseomonas cutis TaxID=2897332 RepID=UPI001E3044C0|nr:EAL domain-containing protein [Roseomonas sp. OT10]UFN48730.1 EAL domain-containing protein [Roseomonas sp. OT10]
MRQPIRWLVGSGIALALLVALGTAWVILDLRTRTVATAGQDLDRLSVALAEQTDQVFQSLDLVQAGLVELLRKTGLAAPGALREARNSPELRRTLQERISGLPQVGALAIFDQEGRPVASSNRHPVPDVTFADREYFAAMRQKGGPETHVSDPVLSRSSGFWTIYLARRIADPDGDFAGFVMGAIQLRHFESFYGRVATSPGEAIVLLRRDGTLLARHPPLSSSNSRDVSHLPGLSRIPPSDEARITWLQSPIDQQNRLVAMRGLRLQPLLLAASRNEDELLRGWRQQRLILGGGALLGELGLAGIVLLGVRQLRSGRRLAQAMAAEAATERALQLQDMRFGHTLATMRQGLCMVDAAGRVQVLNRHLATMLRLPSEEAVIGRPLRALGVQAVAGGAIAAADRRRLTRWLGLAMTRREPASDTWEVDDGRILSLALWPMADGGWMANLDDVTERQQAEERIAHLAYHDQLTGLPNRIMFGERLREAVARAARGEGCALLCLDLDHFKEVNDTLGHPLGDALLRAVTERLRRCVRETDTVARLGGDEFAVLQAAVSRIDEVAALAERLLAELSLPFEFDGRPVAMSVSLGVATLAPGQDGDEDTLLRKADLALFRAKSEGRSRIRFFEPQMEAAIQTRRQLEADLRRALSQQEFELFYQPVLRLRSGEITGFEALLRWRHPQRGLVSPAEFIPFAEESGLVVALGAWALERACIEAAAWPREVKVAVNLSPAQFSRGNAVVGHVRSALERSGLHPGRLELEVTETVVLEETEETLNALHQIRALGVGIALDDFGTGYSSLSYLRKFPFDKVKIDQSFVRDMEQRSDCAAIVRAVIALSASLGMVTLAEGVETEEQRLMLLAERCDEGQGYLFSPPLPAARAHALLAGLSQLAGAG